jgi:hypothetical protein
MGSKPVDKLQPFDKRGLGDEFIGLVHLRHPARAKDHSVHASFLENRGVGAE